MAFSCELIRAFTGVIRVWAERGRSGFACRPSLVLAFFARPGRGADPDASLELRGRMNAELAQCVYPKRKAVEVAADQDAPPIHRVVVEMVRIPEVPRE